MILPLVKNDRVHSASIYAQYSSVFGPSPYSTLLHALEIPIASEVTYFYSSGVHTFTVPFMAQIVPCC